MVIVTKCFKGATYVDRFNNMYRAKTTFVIRQTPFRESYYSLRMDCLSARTLAQSASSEVVASCFIQGECGIQADTNGCKVHPPPSINFKRKDLI